LNDSDISLTVHVFVGFQEDHLKRPTPKIQRTIISLIAGVGWEFFSSTPCPDRL